MIKIKAVQLIIDKSIKRIFAALEQRTAPIVTLALVVIILELLVWGFSIPQYLLPAPHVIVGDILNDSDLYFRHTGVTLLEIVLGYFLGASLGFVAGTVFAYSKLMAKSFLPYLVASTTVPIVAFAPIVAIYFGAGLVGKVVIAAFLCFFPVCLNTYKGLISTESVFKDLFHSYAALRGHLFLLLQLPASLPFVFTGLKLASTAVVVGTIVAEFVQSLKGLGYLILYSAYEMNIPRLWAAVIVSSLLGITFFGLVSLVERRILHWHPSVKDY